jgi:hypothetical protein
MTMNEIIAIGDGFAGVEAKENSLQNLNSIITKLAVIGHKR